ncbi:hypothetical protein B0T22DRAFT_203011 [Podospora appendiculata]|uniref:Uncharacterized protein n=1 Tax=Podospora appendiculata TaxID=314037 RepID=A0AAE1C9T7_9PEZI|nr:hypothetical protein B0T22DRAFT_203011 [Podospora appendiculata]
MLAWMRGGNLCIVTAVIVGWNCERDATFTLYLDMTDLNFRDPFPDSFLAAFAVHDARTPSTPQQCIDSILPGRLSKMCNFLPRGDVVSPNQSMEGGHYRMHFPDSSGA